MCFSPLSLLWWLRLCFCVFFPFLILKPSLRGKESSLSCLHVCKCTYALLSEREREQREPSLQCFLLWPSFWHHLHDDDPSLFLPLLHLYFLSFSLSHIFSWYFVCFSLSSIVFLECLILGTRERQACCCFSPLFRRCSCCYGYCPLFLLLLVSCKLIAFPCKKSIV